MRFNTMIQKKLPGTFQVNVPYKSAGNAIIQKPVAFEVFHLDGNYTAHPLLSKDELRIANLPEELKFTYKKGVVVSSRGKMDSNFHVIEDLVKQIEQNPKSPEGEF